MGSMWFSWLLLAVLLAASLHLYPRWPAQIATHWNGEGEADGFQGRMAALLWPFGWIGSLMALQAAVPRLSRRRFADPSLRRIWGRLMSAVQAVVAMAGLAIGCHGAGIRVPVALMEGAGLSVICIVAGNYLGKLPRNGWIGIRTPWTLASDEVWARTHRQGGPLMMLAGVVCLMLMAAGAAPRWLLWPPLGAAAWSCVYSWWLARQSRPH
ncbi:SdpI family protein [Frateuria aurantia]